MDIKLELLQNYIYDYLKDLFERYPANTSKLVDTTAVMALGEIKNVISNDDLSDFDAIEEIVSILEKYNVNCGARHDI